MKHYNPNKKYKNQITKGTNYLTRLFQEKQIKTKTQDSYIWAWQIYTEFNQLTIDELINEEINEERRNIFEIQRTLNNRINQFREYLQTEEKYSIATKNLIITKIKATYKHYNLYFPNIHSFNTTIQRKKQIPTMEDIKTAVTNTNNIKLQALILFMVSSGCRRSDTCELTIKDIIKATNEYHNAHNIYDVIETLQTRNDVIPNFEATSIKTNITYITFCSNEAIQKILLHLKQRIQNGETLTNDMKVFNIAPSSISKLFRDMNDKMGWGYVGKKRYFHPHALRKRFSTELNKCGISNNHRNLMLGHKVNILDDTYVAWDVETLKNDYLKALNNLTITEEINYVELTQEDKLELIALRKETEELKSELDSWKQLLSKRNSI